MEHWTDFGVGQLPSFSARKKVEFPPPIEALVDERAGAVQQPLQGLTSDGTVRAGLFPLRSTGVSTAPITDAASDFLGALSAEQRQRAVFPLDAEERRMMAPSTTGSRARSCSSSSITIRASRSTMSCHGSRLEDELPRLPSASRPSDCAWRRRRNDVT